jgi:hypothetical protein
MVLEVVRIAIQSPLAITFFDYSEDTPMSQVKGKRVLMLLAKAENHTARFMATNASEGPADESVLVFYDDGGHP